jgi:hypothetical protein
MEVLTQQNLRLQRQLTDERAPKASEGHGEGERNTNEEEDRESKRAVERSQPKNWSRRIEGARHPPLSGDAMNPRYEERRLNEVIAMLDEKYEEKYNQLQQEIQQKRVKGKISRVDSLLNRSSPFTERIMVIQLPEKFKIPTVQTYTRIEDPTKYLDNYKTHMDLQGTPQELACRAFPLTLSNSARDWFRKLSRGSIKGFKDLRRKFLTRFLLGCKQNKPFGQLMAMRQKKGESLKDYVIHFNQARLTVDNSTEEMVYAALYQGLRVERPIMAEITLNHPKNLADLTDVIEKYVNQEETLATLKES